MDTPAAGIVQKKTQINIPQLSGPNGRLWMEPETSWPPECRMPMCNEGSKVPENRHSRAASQDPGERIIPRRRHRIAQCGCFTTPRGEHPDLPCGRNRRITQRHPLEWGLGRIMNGTIDLGTGRHRLGFTGEKRGHMTVLPQTEQDKIQRGLPRCLKGNNTGDFRRRLFRGYLRRFLPADAMNAAGGNPQRPEQQLVGHPEITLAIRRRNTPLIRPEKMHMVKQARRVAPANSPRPNAMNGRGEKLPGDSAARQGDAMRLSCATGSCDLTDPRLGSPRSQIIVAGTGNHFNSTHAFLGDERL